MVLSKSSRFINNCTIALSKPQTPLLVNTASSSAFAISNFASSPRTSNLLPLTQNNSRHFTTTRLTNMPMPKNIVKGGKENLTLKDQSLFKSQAFINGEWVDAKSKSTLKVYNKATQAELGSVPDMTSSETSEAISAAYAAGKEWSKTTGKHRQDLLTKLFQSLQSNSEDLAKIITAENGKCFTEAKGEVAYSNSFVEHFAAEATRMYGHVPAAPMPGVRNVVLKQPIGVAGLITPWNFPAAMITRKLAPALAAGCTAVIKAPSETPFSALAIAELAQRVGFPKGVINIVTCSKGDNEAGVGKEICQNPKVKKVSFTGSTRVGKILMQQSAGTLKKLSFELGGNAPFIVFEDADVDAAVEGALLCKMRSSGQTCVCANRIFIHESLFEEFSTKFAKRVSEFKVGYGMDEGVTHGPLVNQMGVDKVQSHVDESVKNGAKVLTGGKKGEGFFFEPTVLSNLPDTVPMDTEETFGPLAALYSFNDEKEIIEKANDVDVGLAGYFFSKDINRCWRVAEALEVGMVGINTGAISQASVPFGGVKESGFGREGGRDGINEYLVDKLMVFGGLGA